MNVNLMGFKIEQAKTKDALKCLKGGNNARSVLHYELENSPELSKNKKQYISEYMREIRYWNALAYQIILRNLEKD